MLNRLRHYRECLEYRDRARHEKDLMKSGQYYMDATVSAILASITDLTRMQYADDLIPESERTETTAFLPPPRQDGF